MHVDYITYQSNEDIHAVAHWGNYLLPPSWLKRYEQAPLPIQFVLARMLLFRRLTTLGYDYTSLPEMKYTTSGKPYFENHIHFSFTYNQQIVIVAVSETQRIGIDLETIRPISWQSYETYFAAEDWLKIKGSKIPTLDLIEAWVTKEAANKLEGIKSLPQERSKIKIRQKRLHLNGKKYYHEKIKLPPPFVVKIVSQQRFKSIQVQNVTKELSSQSALYILRA